MVVKNHQNWKRYDRKENYERYEDLSSDWEEEEDDLMGEVKDFNKFKEKFMKKCIKEEFKKLLNPKIDKYDNGYELDDEKEVEEEYEEKEESEDEKISAKEKGRKNKVSYDFLKKMMKNKGAVVIK